MHSAHMRVTLHPCAIPIIVFFSLDNFTALVSIIIIGWLQLIDICVVLYFQRQISWPKYGAATMDANYFTRDYFMIDFPRSGEMRIK